MVVSCHLKGHDGISTAHHNSVSIGNDAGLRQIIPEKVSHCTCSMGVLVNVQGDCIVLNTGTPVNGQYKCVSYNT